jgi:hypothetical protein
LIEHYSKLGQLRVVAGEGKLDEVFERMEAAALTKPVPAEKVQVRTTRKARSAPAKKKKASPVKKATKARRKPPRKAARKTAVKRTVRRKTTKRKVTRTSKARRR